MSARAPDPVRRPRQAGGGHGGQAQQRIPLVGGLFRRLFMHHIVLVTVPIALLGILLVGIASGTVQSTLESDNLEVLRRAQGQIEGYAEHVRDQLRLTGVALEQLEVEEAFIEDEGSSGMILDPVGADLLLNQAKSEEVTAAFSHLYAVDQHGRMIATTDYTADRLPDGGFEVSEAVLGTEEFWVKEVRSPPSSDPVTPPELTSVIMGVRLRSSLGSLMGAALAVVNVDSIWAVIDGISVGREGRAFLVDRAGNVIAHREKALVYQATDYSHLTSVQRALAGEIGQVASERTSPDGEPMMAAYGPITAAGLDWALVIHRPRAEVSATEARMRWQIAIMVLFGVAMALISSLVYTRRLVRPLGALAEGANRLSHGELDHKIPVVGRDELGRLATEFNLMVEQLSRIQERLRRAEHLDTLTKFSSVVAHEIRNPLNAMQINIHLLRERIDEQDLQYLDVISAEIKRLENLVREFQNISRPPVLATERTDVNELVTDVVNLEKGTAVGQGIDFSLDLDPQLPRVEVDRNRIHQVVLNLVLNAMQAMPGGGSLRIRTSEWGSTRGGVCITIADTGEGIQRDQLGRVFDFYYTSRSSGSGLGLSVAQQIVDEHGGQITLASAVGEGTTAQVFLPPRPPSSSLSEEDRG